MKKIETVFLPKFLACALVLLFALLTQSAAQQKQKLSAEQWQTDLRFLADELPKRHPNAFRWTKREEFEAAVKTLNDKIPAMSDEEILVGMMRIAAMVNDGHTILFSRAFFEGGVYPVKFYLFKDGLFVQRAAPEYSEIVGRRVVKIGNVSAEEALKLVRALAPADNEMGKIEYVPTFLSVSDFLMGLKIADNKQKLNLTIETGGKEKSFELQPTAKLGELLQTPANWVDAVKTQKPLYQKNPTARYWFEYLKEQKTVYVQQNAVLNEENGETLNAFYKRVIDFVETNNAEKLVIDLRNNNGGNNGFNRPTVINLIKSKINERGHLFVITGRKTFSAAQNFVNELEKYTNAIFVGEPTSGRPNHYGDAVPVFLPNSKLQVSISSIYWQDVDPRDRRQWTAPEIAVEISSEDYRNGKDPALEAVLDYTPGSSFQVMLEAAAEQKDISDFLQKYKVYKKDPKHKFVETEAAINRFGYTLLQNKRIAEAVEIFRLNVEAYPDSANVYDSLGDALQAAGNKTEAIKSYEKALSIQPDYPSSKASLQKLKENR